jgi:hypothetical protein
MTGRDHLVLLATTGITAIAGPLVFVVVSTADERSLALGNAPWAVFPVVWWAVGAIITSRADGHPVGRLLSVVGALAGALVGGLGFLMNPAIPGAAWASLLVAATYGPLFIVLILGSMVLFPDGRLPTARWRLPVLVPVAMVLIATLATVLKAGPFGPGLADNPIGIEALPTGILGTLYVLIPLGIAALGIIGATSVVWRFRRGDPTVRAQLKWLLASVLPVVILTPLSYLAPVEPSSWSPLGFLSTAALLLVPAAIGVAMTRYHLYEIDRLISRGLAWGVLTCLVFGIYATGVLVLQSALDAVIQGETLAVAASTLLAAALVQPLRGRVQREMDRRFDRARYDGDRVVGAFNDRLREQIDLDTLSAEVRDVAAETVRPTSAALWLKTVPDRPATAIS